MKRIDLFAYKIFNNSSSQIYIEVVNNIYHYLSNLNYAPELDADELLEITRSVLDKLLDHVKSFNEIIDEYLAQRYDCNYIFEKPIENIIIDKFQTSDSIYNNNTFKLYILKLLFDDNAKHKLAEIIHDIIKSIEENLYYKILKVDIKTFQKLENFMKSKVINEFNNYLIEIQNPTEEKNGKLVNTVTSFINYMSTEMTAELYEQKNPKPKVKTTLKFKDILNKNYVDKEEIILSILKAPYLDYVDDKNCWKTKRYYARYFFEVLENSNILRNKSFNKFRLIFSTLFQNLKYGSIKNYSRDDLNKDNIKKDIISKLKSIKLI